MRTLRSVLTSPLAALLGLTALAAWPMVRAGYPTIGDGLIHFYRLVEFDHLLRNGVWFPRWATDLGYGYGYPVFNFYSPLTYYLGALFHALGLSFANSLLAVYVAALALAVTGTYRLAREQGGPGGALLAAAAFGLSPYLYFNVLARGALPETLGLGLLPWVLWAFHRVARRPGPAGLMAAAGLYAGLILTHLLGAVLAGPLVILFVALAIVGTRAEGSCWRTVARHLAWTAAALGLTLLLAAYFLVPAAFETGTVQIQQLVWPGDLDFHHNFLILSQLLALPQTFDARLVFIAVAPSLSLAALGLAVVGTVMPWLTRRRLSISAWSLGVWLALAVYCAFTQFFTTPIWEKLPLANIIQFPWRLVGPASLMLALLAGSDELSRFLSAVRGRWPWGLAVWVAVLWLGSLTWSFGPAFAVPASTAVGDLSVYERTSGEFGTTSTGEFSPLQVLARPAPDSLQARYAQSDVIDRVGELPAGLALVNQTATVTSAQAVVEAKSSATLTFDIFYFPGWRATVDGKLTPIRAGSPEGLITVPVDSGRHTVAVWFGDTPLRAAAEWLSVLGLALMVALGILTFRRGRVQTAVRPAAAPVGIGAGAALWVFVPALLLLVVRLTLIDGRDTVFARSRFDGATVSGVDHPLDVNFDNQLVLIGMDLPKTTLPSDSNLAVTLYWRAQNPPRADYSSSVKVVDGAGNVYGQEDSQFPGSVPTTRWRLDQYAEDLHSVPIAPGTPPGVYTLTVAAYEFAGPSLSVLDENQAHQGPVYTLGHVTLTRPQQLPATVYSTMPLHAAMGPLTLVGANIPPGPHDAGSELRFELFWQAGPAPRPDARLQLQLVSPDGHPFQSLTTAPARSDYPTSAWEAGEIVRAPLRLVVPASAPAGPATLQVSLVSSDGTLLGGSATVTTLDVRVPSRSYALPAPAHPRSDTFGTVARLLGYDLTADGITFYWQALAETNTSYTVFVHTLDANGQLLAQSDAVPQLGARPTTGWLPGEVVTDAHALPLSGAANLEVGLYDPQTNERLGQAVVLVP